MALDDPAHGGEADPGALELGVGVQALARCKQPRGVGRVEAGAIVADEDGAVGRHADLDACAGRAAGELPGVAEQVVEQDPDQARIGGDDQPGAITTFTLRFPR